MDIVHIYFFSMPTAVSLQLLGHMGVYDVFVGVSVSEPNQERS